MTKKKILLIEDNQDDISLVQRAFIITRLIEKFDLIIKQNGNEALSYLENKASIAAYQTEDIPIILLDLKLPRMNGFQILKSIRNNEKTRLIPVIIFTSSKEDSDITKSYLLGANSYVRKPIDSKMFNSVIQQIITYWGNTNEFILK